MAASQATLVPVGVDVPPDDEAPADADADGGLADRIWTTRQCRDYTFFRWYVRTSLEEHQHGIKREEFLRLPGLAGNRYVMPRAEGVRKPSLKTLFTSPPPPPTRTGTDAKGQRDHCPTLTYPTMPFPSGLGQCTPAPPLSNEHCVQRTLPFGPYFLRT